MGKPRFNKCCVPGCEDRSNPRHRFPKGDKQLLQQWIKQISNPLITEDSVKQRQYLVCHKHFSDDMKIYGTKRGLKQTAFPILNLNSQGRFYLTITIE